MKILIVYGTNTGNTAYVAEVISSALSGCDVKIQNITSADFNEFKNYDLLIFGTSTWGNGEIQKDWKEALNKINKDILKGKLVALFSLGDSLMFPEQFASGVRDIYDFVIESGAHVVGYWEKDGYNFIFSRAMVLDKFCGLIIDQDNESHLTVQRVVNWIKILEAEMKKYVEGQS